MILGIETSCDETSVAIINEKRELLFHEIYSQYIHHQEFSGVVPEIASREHFNKLPELLKPILKYKNSLKAVASTSEPGLLGPLLVGLTAGKTFSYYLGIPFIPVNHLHAHMCSPLMEKPDLKFPFVNVLLSGGHSLVAIVKSESDFQILAKTVDDACGEAFDKGATALGFPYPGVKRLDELADQGKHTIKFTPSFRQEPKVCNFSFSGHKTALRRILQTEHQYRLEDICHSYREILIEEVCHKIERILRFHPETADLPWTLSGGVASNQTLRKRLKELTGNLIVPHPKFCTDNAAMVANLGLMKFKLKKFGELSIDARPN